MASTELLVDWSKSLENVRQDYIQAKSLLEEKWKLREKIMKGKIQKAFDKVILAALMQYENAALGQQKYLEAVKEFKELMNTW